MAKVITANGNVQIDTAQKKFGSGSGLFDGSGDYLSTPDHNDFNLSNEDFTFDFWVRFNVISASTRYVFCSQHKDADEWFRVLRDSDNKLWIRQQTAGDVIEWGYYVTDDWTPSTNIWYHLAFVRNESNFYIFIDGISQTITIEAAIDTASDLTGDFEIGRHNVATAGYLDGWLDEFRFSKGIARFNSNFAPATNAYTWDSQTALLLHFDGDDGSTTFIDTDTIPVDRYNSVGTNIKKSFQPISY